MGKISRKIIGLLLLLSLTGSSFAAYGAETSDEITKISITVESSIEAGDADADVSVAVSSSRYSVDSWEFSGKSSGWKAGEEPKIKVYLGAADEYYFKKGMSKSKVSVHGGGSCTSLKIRDEGETAELLIKLKAVSGILGNTGSAYWDEDSLGKAKWDKVENANAYEVKLYRGNTLVEHKEKVTGTSWRLIKRKQPPPGTQVPHRREVPVLFREGLLTPLIHRPAVRVTDGFGIRTAGGSKIRTAPIQKTAGSISMTSGICLT